MNVSRKRFLQTMAGGSAVLLFHGCGGGGSDYGGNAPAPAPPAANTCNASTITLNHGHALQIARAEVPDEDWAARSQATADLLLEQHRTLCRPQHQQRVDHRQVDTFVVEIAGEQHVHLTRS